MVFAKIGKMMLVCCVLHCVVMCVVAWCRALEEAQLEVALGQMLDHPNLVRTLGHGAVEMPAPARAARHMPENPDASTTLATPARAQSQQPQEGSTHAPVGTATGLAVGKVERGAPAAAAASPVGTDTDPGARCINVCGQRGAARHGKSPLGGTPRTAGPIPRPCHGVAAGVDVDAQGRMEECVCVDEEAKVRHARASVKAGCGGSNTLWFSNGDGTFPRPLPPLASLHPSLPLPAPAAMLNAAAVDYQALRAAANEQVGGGWQAEGAEDDDAVAAGGSAGSHSALSSGSAHNLLDTGTHGATQSGALHNGLNYVPIHANANVHGLNPLHMGTAHDLPKAQTMAADADNKSRSRVVTPGVSHAVDMGLCQVAQGDGGDGAGGTAAGTAGCGVMCPPPAQGGAARVLQHLVEAGARYAAEVDARPPSFPLHLRTIV